MSLPVRRSEMFAERRNNRKPHSHSSHVAAGRRGRIFRDDDKRRLKAAVRPRIRKILQRLQLEQNFGAVLGALCAIAGLTVPTRDGKGLVCLLRTEPINHRSGLLAIYVRNGDGLEILWEEHYSELLPPAPGRTVV